MSRRHFKEQTAKLSVAAVRQSLRTRQADLGITDSERDLLDAIVQIGARQHTMQPITADNDLAALLKTSVADVKARVASLKRKGLLGPGGDT